MAGTVGSRLLSADECGFLLICRNLIANTPQHSLENDMAASRTFTENTSLQEVLATFQKLRQDDVLLDTTIRVRCFITHERIQSDYLDR